MVDSNLSTSSQRANCSTTLAADSLAGSVPAKCIPFLVIGIAAVSACVPLALAAPFLAPRSAEGWSHRRLLRGMVGAEARLRLLEVKQQPGDCTAPALSPVPSGLGRPLDDFKVRAFS